MLNFNRPKAIMKRKSEILEEFRKYHFLAEMLKLDKDNENEIKRSIFIFYENLLKLNGDP